MMAKSVEQIKAEANKAFKANKFIEAEQLYTSAIELAISISSRTEEEKLTLAILYGNRSNTSLKLEQYGQSITDATEALVENPKYFKAYHRRASAYFALGNYKLAKKDYQILQGILQDKKDATLKLKECERRIREIAFSKAIQSTNPQPKISNTIDLTTFKVDDSYKGPRISEDGIVTLEFINEMIEAFKQQKLLHIQYALQIVLKAKEIFDKLPNVVDVKINKDEHITVCGDVHGQYYDLVNSIFKQNGLPSKENPYVFNGDFVDRGSFSVEVIITLLAIKCYCPESIHLTRGNHESQNMNKIYGFEGECTSKYSETFFKIFTELFQSLPLAYILDGSSVKPNGKRAFIVHGGLFSKDGVTIADINNLDRRQEPDSGIMAEMLWSDPQDADGWGPSKRGIGVAFGPDVTHRFLKHNGLDLVVRSHEMKEEGYEVGAGGKLITIFSAPNYCDSMGNKGAYISFDHRMEPAFKQFFAVPHPNVQAMQYASKLLFNGSGGMQ